MKLSLAALAVIVVGAVFLRLVWGKLWGRGREPGRLQGWLAGHTGTPVFASIVALAVYATVLRLADMPPLRDFSLTPYLTGAAYILVVLSVTWVFYGLVKGLSEWYLTSVASKSESTVNTTIVPAFRRIAQLVLLLLAAAIVLEHYNVKLTALLGAAGVASLAVALAAQDTIANMIAGFTIILDRPFRLGDRLELTDGRIGDVHEIGLRTTRILSFDHTLFVIPNAELAKSSVINHSYPTEKIKVRQTLPLAYGSDVARAKQIIVEICRSHPLALRDPPPEALLASFADTGLRVAFHFWIADYRTRGRVADEVNSAIYARFQEEDILMVAPTELRVTAGDLKDPGSGT